MGRVQAFCQGEELFVQDCYAGADPNYKMPIRIITDKDGIVCLQEICSSLPITKMS